MAETKMLICTALLANAAGRASLARDFISGVSLGFTSRIRAPVFCAPHQQSAACETPATMTPPEAHQAACTGSLCGSTAASMQTFSRVG
jgi:hypothetical protein